MTWRGLIVLLALATAGCQTASLSGNPPALTPVGSGLGVDVVALAPVPKQAAVRAPSSLWNQNDAGLFHDLRARNVGDLVTVSIDINDQAQFDNTSGRSATGSAKGSLAADLGFGGFGVTAQKGNTTGDVTLSGTASSKGEGSIDRSEKLHLLIAAVVSGVLPDGDLLISGSQEVRVNNEVRVLTIAGIVRPLDISVDNTIGYDKIGEARVSYGGRGQLTAVQ